MTPQPRPQEYGKTRVRELGTSRALAEAVSHLHVALSIFNAAGALEASGHAHKAVVAAEVSEKQARKRENQR